MKNKCTKCGEVKSSTDFPNDKNRKNGHHPYCKKCVNDGITRFRNTEKGYLKTRYHGIRGREFRRDRWGRKSKCLFTFEELLTTFKKHKSIYGMKSAWGPGIDHLEQHLPMTISQLGKGRLGKAGIIKGSKRTPSNLSVDRLDPNLDYTIQNIIFIRADENARKKDTSYEDCKIQMRLHQERFINMEAI